jgi:hypothetical protein
MKVEGEAPPDHALLKHVRGGAFFVAKDLKERYDALVARVRALESAVAADQIKGAEALRELRELEPQLNELRKEIEAKKVLVSPVKVQTQTEEFAFDFGPERLLIITADQVRVVGWDKPQVKCMLKKSILATGDQPEDEEFKALRVVHRHGAAPELVGKTDAENTAKEEEFQNSDAGRKLSDAQREGRRQLLNEIQSSYAPFREFQGKELDQIEIEGLTGQQGNRQVTVGVRSAGGGETLGSDWRRSAELTVYVPPCAGVLLRGCLVGLDVENLKAPLTATDSGSRDRDYDGSFQIKGVEGRVKLYNVPLDRLEQIDGDVTLVATLEYANTGTTHEAGKRVYYTPPPRQCAVSDINGDFSAWFARSTLNLESISGRIDVRNEAGNTSLSSKLSPDAAHCIVSECGRIEVRTTAEALGKLPLLAVTGQGSVRTNADSSLLSGTNFTTGNPVDGSRRNWRGVKTNRVNLKGMETSRPFDPEAFLEQARRPAAALAGEPRSAGLDLISRSGAVVVLIEDKK